jgi:hypothetical protein
MKTASFSTSLRNARSGFLNVGDQPGHSKANQRTNDDPVMQSAGENVWPSRSPMCAHSHEEFQFGEIPSNVMQCREKPDDDRLKVVMTIGYSIYHDISLNNCENIARRKEMRVV